MQNIGTFRFLTAALAALALTACGSDDNDGGSGGGKDPKYFALDYAYGTYYHNYWGENAGDYYLVLTDKDLDRADGDRYRHRIDIDFLSVLSTDADHARPLDGEYTIGTAESDKPGVFIEGFLAAGPDGSPSIFGTYWNEPTEEGTTITHPIVGGKMRISTEKGVTTIRAEFIDQRDSVLHVSYQGKLDYENQVNDAYRGDSRLTENYAMKAEAPVVTMKKITAECTSAYDRWDLHFYEKECYDSKGAMGFYIWFTLLTAPGQAYVPSGTYRVTTDTAPGFLPGRKIETGPGAARAVNTWFYAGRSPHAPITNGTLTVKTTNGIDYQVSFSAGDDHPIPYLVTGSFSGTVKEIF